jgi:hypothetical protein
MPRVGLSRTIIGVFSISAQNTFVCLTPENRIQTVDARHLVADQLRIPVCEFIELLFSEDLLLASSLIDAGYIVAFAVVNDDDSLSLPFEAYSMRAGSPWDRIDFRP